MQAIYIPSIPPESAYEAYLLILVIPFFFRIVLVVPPLLDITSKFGGDARWFIGRIREIRVKGLPMLIINEILALFLPFVLAIYARTKFDPVGWPDWDSTPQMAFWLLLAVAFIWLYADLLRVARTRRLLRAVSEKNRFIAKAAVQIAASTRGALDYLRLLSPLDMHSDIRNADAVMEGTVDPKEEPENEPIIEKFGRFLKDRALVVAETVSERIRGKAQQVSEKFDSRIEESVESHAGTSLVLLMRDIVMSLTPIAVLVLLQQYWA
ncbi:MAG: hypothetical protein VYB40_00055 [Candidatus Thermoplasmatota archaeon]|nr:hypothetical protein [Candidatus Thermoplasmatota archaeon]